MIHPETVKTKILSWKDQIVFEPTARNGNDIKNCARNLTFDTQRLYGKIMIVCGYANFLLKISSFLRIKFSTFHELSKKFQKLFKLLSYLTCIIPRFTI